MNEEENDRLRKTIGRMRNECLDYDEAAQLLEKEFGLTWNRNGEVQATAENIIEGITQVMGKTDWTAENWAKLRAIIEEKYDVNGKGIYYDGEESAIGKSDT